VTQSCNCCCCPDPEKNSMGGRVETGKRLIACYSRVLFLFILNIFYFGLSNTTVYIAVVVKEAQSSAVFFFFFWVKSFCFSTVSLPCLSAFF